MKVEVALSMPVDHQEPPAVAERADAGGTALCRSCGFCCDGTLFSSVSVDNADVVSPLVAVGIKIVARDEQRSFRQPCAAHAGRICGVYADRPASCREFRCKVLVDLESRTLDWLRALEQVRQVFALKEAVTEELRRIEPDLVGTSLSELRKRWTTVGDAVEGLAIRQKYGPALICMVALAWYLEQHFFKETTAGRRTRESGENHQGKEAGTQGPGDSTSA